MRKPLVVLLGMMLLICGCESDRRAAARCNLELYDELKIGSPYRVIELANRCLCYESVDSAKFLYYRGNAHLWLGNAGNAYEDFAMHVGTKDLSCTDRVKGYRQMGIVALEGLWDTTQAINAFEQVLHLERECPEALEEEQWVRYKLGVLLRIEGRYAEAVEVLRPRSRVRDSYHWLTLSELAWAYLELGELDSSRLMIEEMTQKDSLVALGGYVLGRIHLAEGRLDSACNYFIDAGWAGSRDADRAYSEYCLGERR